MALHKTKQIMRIYIEKPCVIEVENLDAIKHIWQENDTTPEECNVHTPYSVKPEEIVTSALEPENIMTLEKFHLLYNANKDKMPAILRQSVEELLHVISELPDGCNKNHLYDHLYQVIADDLIPNSPQAS